MIYLFLDSFFEFMILYKVIDSLYFLMRVNIYEYLLKSLYILIYAFENYFEKLFDFMCF